MKSFEDWFNDLSDEEFVELEKKYGYYGHDEGVTTSEWKEIYEEVKFQNYIQDYIEITDTDTISGITRLIITVYNDEVSSPWGTHIEVSFFEMLDMVRRKNKIKFVLES